MALPDGSGAAAADGYARKEAKMNDEHRAFKREANVWAASVAQKVLARTPRGASALVAYVDSPQGGTSKVMLKHGLHHSRLLAVSTDGGIDRLTRRFRNFRKGNVFNGKVSAFFDDQEAAKKVAFFYCDACQAKSECLLRDGLEAVIRTPSVLALMITMIRRNAHGTLWCNYRQVLCELNRQGFLAPGGGGGGSQRDYIMKKGNVVTFLVCRRPCWDLKDAAAPADWALGTASAPPSSPSSSSSLEVDDNAMRKKRKMTTTKALLAAGGKSHRRLKKKLISLKKKAASLFEKKAKKRKASKANKARRRCLAEALATSLAAATQVVSSSSSAAASSVFLDLNKTLPPPLLAVLEAAGVERRTFCTNAGKLSAAVKANVTRGRHWPAKTSLSASAASAAGFFDQGQCFGVLLCYLGFVDDVREIKRRLTDVLALRTTSTATLIWAFECSSRGGVDMSWYNEIIAWLGETHGCCPQPGNLSGMFLPRNKLGDNLRKSQSPGKAFVMEVVSVCRNGRRCHPSS